MFRLSAAHARTAAVLTVSFTRFFSKMFFRLSCVLFFSAVSFGLRFTVFPHSMTDVATENVFQKYPSHSVNLDSHNRYANTLDHVTDPIEEKIGELIFFRNATEDDRAPIKLNYIPFNNCLNGYYGPLCSNKCQCRKKEKCDDGISGTGRCIVVDTIETKLRRINENLEKHKTCNQCINKFESMRTAGKYYRSLDELCFCFNYLAILQEYFPDALDATENQAHADKLISFVDPIPLPNPVAVELYNYDYMQRMFNTRLDGSYIETAFASIMNGKTRIESSIYYSHNYSGHQFGEFVENLGDGRAISIGTVSQPNLDHNNHINSNILEMHLKGSGKNTFSRNGDGKLTRRAAIREYIASMYMYGNGVPTTVSVALLSSKAPCHVVRNPIGTSFYLESSSILLRVAPSFIRFGTLEFIAKKGHHLFMKKMIDYIMEEFYKENNRNIDLKSTEEITKQFIYLVSMKTAFLIAKWNSVFFCHGVLNTDNMSIIGASLDFGPFAFMQTLNNSFVCNHDDTEKRYSFGNQYNIGLQNLLILSHAVDSSISFHLKENVNTTHIATTTYQQFYRKFYYCNYYFKLGFIADNCGPSNTKFNDLKGRFKIYFDTNRKMKQEFLFSKEEHEIVDYYLTLLESSQTNTIHGFGKLHEAIENSAKYCSTYMQFNQEDCEKWVEKYRTRIHALHISAEQHKSRITSGNPAFSPYNHLLESLINESYNGNWNLAKDFVDLCAHPYHHDSTSVNTDLDTLFSSNVTPLWADEIIQTCSS